jgi:hypothetical protein
MATQKYMTREINGRDTDHFHMPKSPPFLPSLNLPTSAKQHQFCLIQSRDSVERNF